MRHLFFRRPTAAQLREAARIAREMARGVIAMVKAAERKADQLEHRTTPARVDVPSHQSSHSR